MSAPRAGLAEAGPLGLPPARVALLAAAAAVLAATVFARPWANPDSLAFAALARSLASGHGFAYVEPMLPWVTLRAFRSPGYPLLLAPLLPLGGAALALAVNGVLHVLTALQAGEIAARHASRRLGLAAFALVLAWPQAWLFAGQVMSETLFACLSAGALRAALEARTARGAALAGALAAAALLTRPVGIGVALGVLLALFARQRRLLPAALAALVLVTAPWPVRNALELGSPVAFTTNGGFNLCAGHEQVATSVLWEEMSHWTGAGELEIDRRWKERWREGVRRDPAGEAKRVAVGFAKYLFPLDRPVRAWPARALEGLAVAALALAAGTPAGLALGGTWAVQAAINALATVNERYRFPSEWLVPVLAMLAAHAIAVRFGRRAPALVAALAGSGLLLLAAQVLLKRG